MSSLSRACLEISNSIKGFRLGRSSPTDSTAGKEGVTNITNMRTAATVTNTITRAIKSATNRVRGATAFENRTVQNQYMCSMMKRCPQDPWTDEKFLDRFFSYFSPCERSVLSQVCKQWRNILYNSKHWLGITPVLNCKVWQKDDEGRARFYQSLEDRAFDSIIISGATDADIAEFINNFPNSRKVIHTLALRCSNISDTGLENITEKMTGLVKLELSGCNEITESALWSCLNARIVCLSISDCINVADDSVGAIAQLLPSLLELNMQAYHVTDTSLSFFSAKQSYHLTVLRLFSCWEVTNHGIVNIVHALPNLTVLSLSGCSKITDDGVELIAEHLRKLTSLDLSWCPRITDAGLEYIACDLATLEELILDRCCHVTDIGVGYLSSMSCLLRLYLRWCTEVRDLGLQHLYTMKHLKVLSLAGCNMLSSNGLTGLVQLPALEELELTNCPGAMPDVIRYLQENMDTCTIVE